MNIVIPFIKKHIAACIILASSLVLGFIVFGDYGIAWDEINQAAIGEKSYQYVFHRDKTLNNFKDRDYGVAIELPLVMIQRLPPFKDVRNIFRMRHLVVHIFFLLGAFAFYLLIWILYRNRFLAVSGYLILLISPKIYAQSFYNSKDIPFMCMFILCLLACAIAFRDKKIRQYIIFGILSGLLINTRIMGILIPAIVTFLIIVDLTNGPDRKRTLINYIVYMGFSIGVLILTWPWLWEHPFEHLKLAFSNMSNFRWGNNVLFNGTFVRSYSIGWTYLPQWFGLTTPIVYLILGFTGIIFLIFRFIQKPLEFLRSSLQRNQLIFLACFAGPIIAVIARHSVLYDGWRQMYFIYPAFLLLAIYGLSSILNSRNFSGDLPKIMVSFILVISCAGIGFTMIKSHPFEDVYFNILLSKKENYLRKTYELDYWGTSYKQALEYIVSHDPSTILKIKVANLPGEHNCFILKSEDRNRIRYVDSDREADYFITDYRWHPWDYNYPKEKKIFSITVQNSEICTAWKLH